MTQLSDTVWHKIVASYEISALFNLSCVWVLHMLPALIQHWVNLRVLTKDCSWTNTPPPLLNFRTVIVEMIITWLLLHHGLSSSLSHLLLLMPWSSQGNLKPAPSVVVTVTHVWIWWNGSQWIWFDLRLSHCVYVGLCVLYIYLSWKWRMYEFDEMDHNGYGLI